MATREQRRAAADAFRTKQEMFTHEELAAIIGVEYPSNDYYQAVRLGLLDVLPECIVYENRFGQGYYLCDTQQALDTNDKYRARNWRNAKRGIRRIHYRIAGQNLTQEQGWKATAQSIIYSQTMMINSRDNERELVVTAKSTDVSDFKNMSEKMVGIAAAMFPKRKKE